MERQPSEAEHHCAASAASLSSRCQASNQGPDAEEDLDPRIQVELEKLNSSTDVINKLELDLEEARSKFRSLLQESGRRLNEYQKEIGPTVEKARPYYEARMAARAALSEAQNAAARFEKASSAHEAAKEMVTVAEKGFRERGVVHFDQAWQEMLNHATTRVNESEVERNVSEEEHLVRSRAYREVEAKVQTFQKSLKRSIKQSRRYFDAKAQLNQLLDDQKRQIQVIEETIQMTKVGYAGSLKELERISEEIHERRRRNSVVDRRRDHGLGARQDGVGAECPSPSPIEAALEIKKSRSLLGVSSRKGKTQLQRNSSVGGIKDSTALCTSTPLQGGSAPAASSSIQKAPSVSSSSTESPDSASSSVAPSPSRYVSRGRFTVAAAKLFTPVNKRLSVRNEDPDFSDGDSIASAETLDDEQIDQLMKDASIQKTADDLLLLAGQAKAANVPSNATTNGCDKPI